jgi:hypothetical protein
MPAPIKPEASIARMIFALSIVTRPSPSTLFTADCL